jgi:intracellular multiplication protein IcmJ
VLWATYTWRATQGLHNDRARRLLERLMARRSAAIQNAGTDRPDEFSERLRRHLHVRPEVHFDQILAGIRVLPLDRRIVRDSDLSWNQFPYILAFWRSPDGPLGKDSPNSVPAVADLERILLEPAEVEQVRPIWRRNLNG